MSKFEAAVRGRMASHGETRDEAAVSVVMTKMLAEIIRDIIQGDPEIRAMVAHELGRK